MTAKHGLLAVLLAAALSGCAGGLGGGDYERSDTRRVYEVKMGTVEAVRPVSIEGTKSGIGAVAGGAVGGIAGSSVGGGKGAAVAAVLGAVAGGVAGAASEQAVTRKPGIEIILRLDSGRTLAVVQEDTGETFRVGDRVRLLEANGEARVSR